jgi:hypothetical protein
MSLGLGMTKNYYLPTPSNSENLSSSSHLRSLSSRKLKEREKENEKNGGSVIEQNIGGVRYGALGNNKRGKYSDKDIQKRFTKTWYEKVEDYFKRNVLLRPIIVDDSLLNGPPVDNSREETFSDQIKQFIINKPGSMVTPLYSLKIDFKSPPFNVITVCILLILGIFIQKLSGRHLCSGYALDRVAYTSLLFGMIYRIVMRVSKDPQLQLIDPGLEYSSGYYLPIYRYKLIVFTGENGLYAACMYCTCLGRIFDFLLFFAFGACLDLYDGVVVSNLCACFDIPDTDISTAEKKRVEKEAKQGIVHLKQLALLLVVITANWTWWRCWASE